ncbi:acyl-CoA dehydrogenase family protein [Microbacterium sp. Leaf288]|uniref:acyl-CoA dehydrogenase family protein n=1 Tax=Microbacterium sp. Leaf288 TaxID=1736323 RepID=UPI000A944B4F|nr:acyl-CoA dehydrogenase family protein [Microbacterium sp. Leaf288]
MSIAESVERARPAFGRDVSTGLDALEPLIGRVGVGMHEGGQVVTSALRGYRFGAAAADATAPATLVRAAVPAAALGAIDAALRESVRYAHARHLYGGTVLDIPHARSLLAAALADALTADALSSAAVCLADAHAPAASIAVAVSAHLSCLLLADAAQQVSVLAGSTFYARISPFEIIEQHVRDLSALSVLVPDLADPLPAALEGVSRWCSDADAAAPASLLRPEVMAAIAADAPGAVEVHVALAAAAAETAAEAGEPADAHAALELAHRVSLLTAAAAVVAGWMQARGSEAIAGDPLAMEACLRRIRGRVVRRQPPLAVDLVARLVAHAEARAASGEEMAIGPARATVPLT